MSESTRNAADRLAEVFNSWKEEHEQLDATMLELFRWINDPLHHRRPPYSLAAERLQALLRQLRVHFAHEETLGEMLAASHGGVSDEIKGVCQRVGSDHRTLGNRLQVIIDELVRGSEARPPVIPEDINDGESPENTQWSSILVQFNLFYDLLEQHEEQEEQAVHWLRPSA